MIRINELSIGDYVGFLPTWENEDGSIQRDGNPNDPIICKVEMLSYDAVQLYNGEGTFDADDIELYPIPLTPEILEKNGFKKCDGCNQWTLYKPSFYCILCDIDKPYLEIDSYNGDIGEFNRFGIQFIHQLQHALRLCGIEKTLSYE